MREGGRRVTNGVRQSPRGNLKDAKRRCPRPPNGSYAKLCGRFRVPKPKRRAGCCRGVGNLRLAICNRRDAVKLAMK
jgi:hypothetical protein